MTARDEAIDEIGHSYHQWMYGDNGTNDTLTEAEQIAEHIVRNLAPGLLARLAIDTGALTEVPVDWASDQDEDNYGPLYRVVEP